MATVRVVTAVSLGPSRGDAAAGATLTVGTDISAQEAVNLAQSGTVSGAASADSPISASAALGVMAASRGWVPSQYIEASEGFSLGVTDVKKFDVLYVSPEQATRFSKDGRWMRTPLSIVVTAGSNGIVDKLGTTYMAHNAAEFVLTLDPDTGYHTDASGTLVDGVAAGALLVGDVITLSGVAANHTVAAAFAAD